MMKTDGDKKDALIAAIRTAAGDIAVSINISCKIGVGDHMGVITNANNVCVNEEFVTGETSIEHKEGQVLLLDLWATWCPPCQKPMAHN